MTLDEKVAYIKAVVAKKVKPELLPTTPEIEAELDRHFPDIDPKMRVLFRQSMNIHRLYAGRQLLTYVMPGDIDVPLAVGPDEISAVRARLTDAERRKLVLDFAYSSEYDGSWGKKIVMPASEQEVA